MAPPCMSNSSTPLGLTHIGLTTVMPGTLIILKLPLGLVDYTVLNNVAVASLATSGKWVNAQI